MPSGELVGTTLKLTTGREVTDGHSLYTNNDRLLEEFDFCTRPYSNASVDRAGTPNPSSK
jgi:hypothetical protein